MEAKMSRKRVGSYYGGSAVVRATPNPIKEEMAEQAEARAKAKREKRINVIERARRSVKRAHK
jgi:hypothetical protein